MIVMTSVVFPCQVEAGKAELEKLQKANQNRQNEIREVCTRTTSLYSALSPPLVIYSLSLSLPLLPPPSMVGSS